MHTPQDFHQQSSFVVVTRKLRRRHPDDRIHMHFHDNPTDTQHHSAHTHEVSLASTTPHCSPSDTARSKFGCQTELPPSTERGVDIDMLGRSTVFGFATLEHTVVSFTREVPSLSHALWSHCVLRHTIAQILRRRCPATASA